MKDRMRSLGEDRQPGWAGTIVSSSVHTRQAVWKDWQLSISPFIESNPPPPQSASPPAVFLADGGTMPYTCVFTFYLHVSFGHY